MAVISVINQKGGCGKTTTAVNLSTGLVKRGYKVLLVDMDPQGHSTLGLGFNPDSLRQTIFDAIDERDQEISLSSVLLDISDRMHIAPANVFLSAFEQSMAGKAWRESRLAKTLAKVRTRYDYIVIDCPPSLGLLTVNSLLASTHVVVPIDSGYYSLEGVKKLRQTMEMLRSKVDHDLEVKHLITFYDSKSTFNRDFSADLKEIAGNNSVFKQKIRRSVKFNVSQRLGKTVIELGSKKCGVAFKDYFALTQEVIDWTKGTQNNKISLLRSSKTKLRTKNIRSVGFVYSGPAAKVQLAADFNDWRPMPMKNTNGGWESVIKLSPGSYEYKFIVDGDWVTDPANENIVEKTGDIINSLLTVA